MSRQRTWARPTPASANMVLVMDDIRTTLERIRWTVPFTVPPLEAYKALFPPAEGAMLVGGQHMSNNMRRVLDFSFCVNCQREDTLFYYTTPSPVPNTADGKIQYFQIYPGYKFDKEIVEWLGDVRHKEKKLTTEKNALSDVEDWCERQGVTGQELASLWPTFRNFLFKAEDYALALEPAKPAREDFHKRFKLVVPKLDLAIGTALMLPTQVEYARPTAWEEF